MNDVVTCEASLLDGKNVKIPAHIAMIMDGNGRWATRRFLPRFAGHIQGVRAVRKIVRACVERDVRYLTLFAFSSENWKRPEDEVSLLMKLFRKVLVSELKILKANGIRLNVIGDKSRFDADLQALIQQAEQATAGNDKLTLTVCANYGGRWDIVNACRQLLSEGANVADITEERISAQLSMNDMPEPDLLIRTGGEARVSNFLLWQMAYTEFYFTDVYWPEFDGKELDKAIMSFQCRERRFGCTSEQVQSAGR